MSDSSGDSLTISPIGLPGLAGITPVALQLLTTGTTTAVSSTFDSGSSLIELSGVGQLLSAVSAFRNTLETLQTGAADNSQARAQDFVDAFNRLQGRIGNLQTLFQALPGTSLVDQLSLSLDELATKNIAAGSSGLDSLEKIGITLQSASSPNTATGTTLRIDQNRLNAAIAADAPGTRAVLDRTIQSFAAQAAAFEVQSADAAISLSTLTQLGNSATQAIDLSTLLGLNTHSTLQGIAVPTNALQGLSADTVLNDIELADLDLAAVGLDAGSISSDNTVRQGALSTTLLSPSSTAAELATTATLLATDPAGTTPQALATTPPPGIASTVEIPPVSIPAPAPPTGNTATVASAALATPATAGTIADTVASDRRASEATQALQNLLADPSRRAINNNLFDPAYAALIAASHLNDFALPAPGAQPKTPPADLPVPVVPAALARAIGYYNNEAPGGAILKRG